jgi:hypothetical protein
MWSFNMSFLQIGKTKNLAQMIVNLAKVHFQHDNESPFIVNNKQFPIIEESAYIVEALENAGFKVKTFTTGGTYGLEISK